MEQQVVGRLGLTWYATENHGNWWVFGAKPDGADGSYGSIVVRTHVEPIGDLSVSSQDAAEAMAEAMNASDP